MYIAVVLQFPYKTDLWGESIMTEKAGLLVYLWFIPLLLQLVLPLATLFIWLIYRLAKSIASRKTVRQTITSIERRRYPRIAGELIGAVIADNKGRIIGKVKNISTSGICVTNFSKHAGNIQGEITMRTNENNSFNLLVQPHWIKGQQSGKDFGASILNQPVGWPVLVRPAGYN